MVPFLPLYTLTLREAEALDLSIKLAKKVKAELVLACDPDGDRTAAVVPNENGDYELLNGNQTGALIIYYLLNPLSGTRPFDR